MINEARKKNGIPISLTILKNSAIAIGALKSLPSFRGMIDRLEEMKENRERKSLGMSPLEKTPPDLIKKQIIKLKSIQSLEPIVQATYSFGLSREERQNKHQTFLSASRKRSSRIHHLEDLQNKKRQADYTMDSLRFDNPVWEDIPLKDQFGHSLEEMTKITDLLIPMSEESSSTQYGSQRILSERHLDLLEQYSQMAESVIDNDFKYKKSEIDIASAYLGYFQYYLLKSGRAARLPKMTDLKFTTDLIDNLPYCVADFHARVLPEIIIKQLKARELQGQKTSPEEWYEVFREQTRRLTVLNIGKGIYSFENTKSTNELFLWRTDYLEVADRLNLHLVDKKGHDSKKTPVLKTPDLAAVKNEIFLRMEEMMSDRDAKTLVMGFSGDLDSAFMLILLAEVIRERNLPFKIAAFTLKKDHHGSRFERIEELINYANRNLEDPIVSFKTYDFEHSFQAFLLSLLRGGDNFSEPTAKLALDTIKLTAQVAMRAVDTLYKGKEDSRKKRKKKEYGIASDTGLISSVASFLTNNLDDESLRLLHEECQTIIGTESPIIPSEQLINLVGHLIKDDVLGQVDARFGPREQSNIIHEFVMAIRGNISRSVKWPLTMSGNNLTELAFDNVTTADAFVAWMPLAPYPKALIANTFNEIIETSSGGITPDFWKDRPLKFLVPWYPDSMKISSEGGMQKIVRTPWFINEFTEVELNPELSAIPAEIWANIHQSGENFICIDGNVQWYLDPYIHYFIQHGLSKRSIKDLTKDYPSRKTDILFTAMLMANAVEKRQKSIFFHQAARHNLGGKY